MGDVSKNSEPSPESIEPKKKISWDSETTRHLITFSVVVIIVLALVFGYILNPSAFPYDASKWNEDILTVNAANYDTIKAAISALPSEGGDVIIPPGDYFEPSEERLVIPEGVNLIGSGYGNTEISLNVTASKMGILLQGSNIVSGLKIDFNNESGGIAVLGSDVTIKGCHLLNANTGPFEYHVIRLTGTESIHTTRINILNNRIEGGGDDGIGIDNVYAYDILIKENYFADNHDSGIEVNDGGHDVIIEGNFIETRSGVEGIDIHSHANNPKVRNVIITNNIAEGLAIFEYDGWVGRHENIFAEGNIINGPAIFSNIKNGGVSGNIFYGSLGDGIQVKDCEMVTISENHIKYANARGIRLERAEWVIIENNIIEGCSVLSTEHFAIDVIESKHCEITDNQIFCDISTTSNLTENAMSNQNIVKVVDATAFNEGQPITIIDNANSESNIIDSICGTNTLVMAYDLSNTYITLENGKIIARDTGYHGIGIKNTCEYIIVTENLIDSTCSNKIDDAGIATEISGNIGYMTENSGQAIILDGEDSVQVNHGLVATPTIVVLGSTHTETANAIYVADDTKITITVSMNVTADRTISWYAEI